MDRLDTGQARVLHKAMLDARKALDEAYEKYQSALVVAMNTNPADATTLRQEGRTYAAALTRYTEATMAWLGFVETHFHPKKAESAGESV